MTVINWCQVVTNWCQLCFLLKLFVKLIASINYILNVLEYSFLNIHLQNNLQSMVYTAEF